MNPSPLLLSAALAFAGCGTPTSPSAQTPPAADTIAQRSADVPQVVHTPDGGRMEGTVRDGKRQGPWVAYNAQGGVRSRAVYEDGLEEGPTEVYHENGLTKYTGQYLHGVTVGEWIFYDPQGKEVKRVVYDDDGNIVSQSPE